MSVSRITKSLCHMLRWLQQLGWRFWEVALPKLMPGERVLLDAGGYLIRGVWSNSARTVLTTQRLFVLSYRTPVLPDRRITPQMAIPISNIERVELSSSADRLSGRVPRLRIVQIRLRDGSDVHVQIREAVGLKQKLDALIGIEHPGGPSHSDG